MKQIAVFVGLGLFSFSQINAQVAVKLGLSQHSYSSAEVQYILDTDGSNSAALDLPDGGAFYVPLQVGATVGEDRNYDVGLGLNLGSLRLSSDGKEYKTRLLSPNFYVEYYLVNRWFPLQFGLGAAVSYSKVNLDWTVSIPNELDQMEELETKTTWAGLGYGVSLLGRYWLDEDMTNAVQLGVGNRADWRKLKSLNVSGTDVTFDRADARNMYDTGGLFFTLSYVRVFGE